MEMEVLKRGDFQIVIPKEPRIDASMAKTFKEKMAGLIGEGPASMVIDMSGVEFVDSSGLGVLVSVLKQVGNRGEVKLSGVRDGVLSLLELTRLDKVFALYRTRQEAIDSFGAR